MQLDDADELKFEKELIASRFIHPDGRQVESIIEVRVNPVTGRTSRIAFNRSKEKESGTERLPAPPPDARQTGTCPFCRPQAFEQTPRLAKDQFDKGRLEHRASLLFPNLFPYGRYSAVSLFDNSHFVEIGKASLDSYTDSFINCQNYLTALFRSDPHAIYMAITQNHLPSAGGSLVHPHLQVHADRIATNHHRFLRRRCAAYHARRGRHLFSDYLACEKKQHERYIGKTGDWHWMAAFAPEGFFEIWGILPGWFSLLGLDHEQWHSLARGVLNVQRFYRSLNRNGYNLGLLCQQDGRDVMELRVVILARSNYAPWVRNDHTGYEVMLGDMTTFSAPEKTAAAARPFWAD